MASESLDAAGAPVRLERFSAVCQRHGVWLVVDNTYEHFTYEEESISALSMASLRFFDLPTPCCKEYRPNLIELMHGVV